MFLKIDEEVLKTIQEITMTDYELEGNFLPVESVDDIINDLLWEIHNLQEKIEDLEKDIEENYKPIPVAEEYGISEKDFY